MEHLEHERLDLYAVALDFAVASDAIADAFPRGRAYLTDQLRRAATSVVLNVAEGAGEFSPDEKVRFYRMAKRSGTECAAVLDLAQRLELVDIDRCRQVRVLLVRVVSMLTALILSFQKSTRSASS